MASGTRITTTGVLYINGSQVENTFSNVSKITRKLESELKKLTPGTQEFIDKAAEVRLARARFEEVRNEINAVSRSIDSAAPKISFLRRNLLSLGDTFRQVFTADLASRFFDIVIDKGRMTVDQLLKVADAMTDVQKTSGMSLAEVKELWDAFDEMDTRTSKLDRLKIAEVGGRLGVPTEQMKDFVQEVDKAYVALGDSFEGGLEGVVDQLGKIKGLFEDTKSMTYAEAINRVGSALNTLAAQGTASEGNIAQFALRVGTLPEALRPAIDKVLGLGAAFEESGIDSQIASSGFANFMSTAGQNIESFAYSMNMSVKEAKELINTKPEEFFLRFAQGMKGLDAVQTSKILESLKLNSLEVQKAVGAAANKTDDFRKAMKTAGSEMEKMTSLQDEFNQKNNNAPAILEKIKNEFNDMFTSTNIINHFEWLVNILGWITGVTKDAGEEISGFRERLAFLGNIIKVVGTAILGYNASVLIATISTGNLTKITWLNIIADKAQAAGLLIKRVALLAYNVVLGIVTLNTQRITAATIAFNTVAKASPWGVLFTLVATAVVAYKAFSKEVNIAVKNQKDLNDAMKDAERNVASEISNLKILYSTATDVRKSTDERTEAVRKLKEEYPSYFQNISDEIIMNGKAEKSYNDLRDAIIASARASAARSIIEKREGERLEEDRKLQEKLDAKKKALKKAEADPNKEEVRRVDGGDGKMTTIVISNDLKVKGAKIELKEVQDDIEKKKKEREAADKFFIDTINESDKKAQKYNDDKKTPTNVVVPDVKKNRSGKSDEEKAAEKLKRQNEADLKKSKEEAKKAEQLKKDSDDKMLELQRAYEDEKQKILNESRQKAIDDETRDFERKKEDLKIQNKKIQEEIDNSNEQIKELEISKSETKSPEAKKEFEKAISGLEEANKKRKNLKSINDKIIEQMEQTHQFNLGKIKEIWDAKDFELWINHENARINASRRADEDEINEINSLAEAKEKLQNLQYLKLTDTELKNIKSLEDAKRFLREEADRKMLAAQLASFEKQKEMLVQAISQISDGEARKKLLEDLELLKDKITQVKTAIDGGTQTDNKAVVDESSSKKEKVDILGFSVKDWEETFKNLDTTEGKVAAVGKVFAAMGNLAASFGELQRSLGERDLKRFKKEQTEKQKELLKQLNSGYISQEEYHKGVELLETQLANKQAEIEYKQAKAEKVSRIFSAIGATAQGVANSLALGGPLGIAMAAVVGALGALQIATIMAQPLPERPSFAEGGFFEGFTGASSFSPDETGERPIGLVKLHEKEWTGPKWMTQHPRLASTFDWLESVRKTKQVPSFADGGFADGSASSPVVASQNSDNSTMYYEYISVLTDVKELLQKLSDDGVMAYIIEDAENGKKILRMIKSYEKIEQRASGK